MSKAPRARPGSWRCIARQAVVDPRVQAVVFTIALCILAAVLAHSALRKGGLWDTTRSNDFRAYHTAAHAALEGHLETAYADPERPYQYPPTLAALILPLGSVPYRVGLVIWVLASLALVIWVFRVLDRVLCPPVRGLDKFVGFLFVYRMLESDFANTNANVIVLGLVIGGFALERRARPVAAGLTMALAACFKVTPLLLLPWMLYRPRRRLAGAFAAGLVLWGVIVPGTILGPAQLARAYAAWNEGLLAPLNPAAEEYGREESDGYVPGQSLRALLHRLLRPIDATAHDEAARAINVATLDRGAVDALWAALAAAALGAALWLSRRRGKGAAWGGAEIGVAMALTVILAPLARKAHFVALWPAATYGFVLARAARGRERAVLGGLWGLALLLVVGTSPEVIGDAPSALVLGYCPLAIAGLILAALPYLARAPVSAAGADPSHPAAPGRSG